MNEVYDICGVRSLILKNIESILSIKDGVVLFDENLECNVFLIGDKRFPKCGKIWVVVDDENGIPIETQVRFVYSKKTTSHNSTSVDYVVVGMQ